MPRHVLLRKSHLREYNQKLSSTLCILRAPPDEVGRHEKSFVRHQTTAMPSEEMPVLPEEILQLVFEQLRHPLDKLDHRSRQEFTTTICAICLTSKQCLRLARPILYRNVHFTAGLSPEARIQKFSQSVVQHSQLAKLVQEMSFDDWGLDSQDDIDNGAATNARYPPPRSLRSTYAEALGSLTPYYPGLINEIELVDAIMSGTEDALIACILTQCSNLQKLSLVIPHSFKESWTHNILKCASITQHWQQDHSTEVSTKALPHLKEFRTEHWDTENATRITNISEVLRIPSLRKYHGFAVDVSIENHPLQGHPDPMRPFNIETFQLQYSLADADGISNLLRCCPNLKHLSIGFGPSTVGFSELQFDDVGNALRAHGKKLKSLTLDIEESDFDEMQEQDVIAPLGSLKSLEELKVLKIPKVALWGEEDEDDASSAGVEDLEDILPASLRKLFILCAGPSNEEEAGQIKAALEEMGNLRLVKFGRERFSKNEDETEEIGAGNEDAER